MVAQNMRMRKKGQITIPSEIREDYGLHVGETVTIERVADGILIRKARDIARSTAGALSHYTIGKPALSPEDINRIAADEIGAIGLRTLREIEEEYDKS